MGASRNPRGLPYSRFRGKAFRPNRPSSSHVWSRYAPAPLTTPSLRRMMGPEPKPTPRPRHPPLHCSRPPIWGTVVMTVWVSRRCLFPSYSHYFCLTRYHNMCAGAILILSVIPNNHDGAMPLPAEARGTSTNLNLSKPKLEIL